VGPDGARGEGSKGRLRQWGGESGRWGAVVEGGGGGKAGGAVKVGKGRRRRGDREGGRVLGEKG